jgi:hypothetical protein
MPESRHVQPAADEAPLTQEGWARFHSDYRVEFDFCRILQTDYIEASASLFDTADLPQAGARVMVHCFGSLIDGLSGSMRRIAIATCKLFGRPLNPFLQDKAEERGITTHNRIFTSYRLIGEFLPRSPLAALPDGFWDDLHAVIEIRNRIVHPKRMQDLEVTLSDALLVASMGDEFCDHVNKFAIWLTQKEQKLVWEHVVERRRLYPKVGRNERCPCGSGRKYKNCCEAAALAA